MKAKLITFTIATIVAGILTSAEAAQTIVKGRINDKNTGESEIGAVVQFFKAGDLEKPLAYTITNEDGNFSHSLDMEGEYVPLFTNVEANAKVQMTILAEAIQADPIDAVKDAWGKTNPCVPKA